MIHNDQELQGTQERIAFFCRLVAHMRQVESPADFRYMASGYLAEIEKMHAEVMVYLSRHASELVGTKGRASCQTKKAPGASTHTL